MARRAGHMQDNGFKREKCIMYDVLTEDKNMRIIVNTELVQSIWIDIGGD